MLDGYLNLWPELQILAQEAPALPLDSGQPATTGGNGAAAGQPAGKGPFNETFMLLMFGMLGLIIVMSIMGQRRDRKKREKLLSAVKKHDRVQTIGGVIGSVVDVKAHEVVLKVDESSNTRITFARSAVQQILTGDGDAVTAAATPESLS